MAISSLPGTYLRCQGHILPLEFVPRTGIYSMLRYQLDIFGDALTPYSLNSHCLFFHGSISLVPLPCLVQKFLTELEGLGIGYILPGAPLGQFLPGAATSSGAILQGTNPHLLRNQWHSLLHASMWRNLLRSHLFSICIFILWDLLQVQGIK